MYSARQLAAAAAASWTNLRFVFSIAVVTVFASKAVHLYAHLPAISTSDRAHWGLSFVAQDVALLLLIGLSFDADVLERVPQRVRVVVPTVGSALVAVMLFLATTNVSFFAVVGTPVRWANVGFAGDASSRKVLLEGLFSFVLTGVVLVGLSWVLQDPCHRVLGTTLDLFKVVLPWLWTQIPGTKQLLSRDSYTHLSQDEEAELEYLKGDEADLDAESDESDVDETTSKWKMLTSVVIATTLLALLITTVARPSGRSLLFMSWTLPLLPFVDFADSYPVLETLVPIHGSGIQLRWDNKTALHEPPSFPWLPEHTPLPGFGDWYDANATHYRADKDPLRVSNLEQHLLPALRMGLRSVKIRHVVLVKLESTRQDVFPIKNGSYIWNRLAQSYPDDRLPKHVQDFLASLTPTANFLTGDYDDGFQHLFPTARGGINCKNAHTTSSYTLKSLAGTFCGVTPLSVDWNAEALNHIYQPCLPHIFNALNHVDHGGDNNASVSDHDDFTSFPWKSSFMQPVTGIFDNQDVLMDKMGFPPEDTIAFEYLKGPSPKFGPPKLPDTHTWMLPEMVLEDYVRDAFVSAKKNKERVFLGHLTGSTHMPLLIPESQEYVALSEDERFDYLSRYINIVGSVDKWLRRILDVLHEQDVADETLVVVVGDHGLSIAEQLTVSPYFNPHEANLHVPLVFSHPKLPPLNVEVPVNSIQILPTILDLLRSSASLSPSDTRAVSDLLANYEGQSLARTAKRVSDVTGQPAWQVSIVNPGRSLLSVRDPGRPGWRVAVPVVSGVEWRFVDEYNDPREYRPVRALTFEAFIEGVGERYGEKAARWAEAAAFMARWWLRENHARWRYDAEWTKEETDRIEDNRTTTWQNPVNSTTEDE